MTAARPRRLLIRVDGSSAIGTGHVQRCLALAGAMRRRGWRVTFASVRAPGDGLDRAAGFEVIELPAGLDPTTEVAAIASADPSGPTAPFAALVLDHYGLDAAWLEGARPLARRRLVIDDLADRPLSCELLVDAGPDASPAKYGGRLRGRRPRLLLGPRYALLRAGFAEAHAEAAGRTFGEVRRVLVAMGGADASDATGVAARAVEEALPGVRMDVAVGAAYPHDTAGLTGPRRTVHRAVANIERLMLAADLAVGAGGVSALERCAVGLPSLVLQLAANQAATAGTLDGLGAAVDLGPWTELEPGRLVEAIRDLARDPERRRRMAEAAHRLVDGRGTERVAHALEGIRLRRATEADEALLLEWANHPETRANSLSSEPIAAATHREWLAQRLSDPATLLLIGQNGAGPLGQVRFDLRPDEAIVSISVAPAQRGTVGALLLESGLRRLRQVHPELPVRAQVKEGNAASKRLFEGAGFVEAGRAGGVIDYVLPARERRRVG